MKWTKRWAWMTLGSLAVGIVAPAIETETRIFDLQHIHRELASFLERDPNVFEEVVSITGSFNGPGIWFKTMIPASITVVPLSGDPSGFQFLKHSRSSPSLQPWQPPRQRWWNPRLSASQAVFHSSLKRSRLFTRCLKPSGTIRTLPVIGHRQGLIIISSDDGISHYSAGIAVTQHLHRRPTYSGHEGKSANPNHQCLS